MKLKDKGNKLKNVVWSSLTFFSCIKMLLLFVMQILLLKQFYELYKRKQLDKAANNIIESEVIDNESLENIAFENGLCVLVYKNDSLNTVSNVFNKGCVGGYDKDFGNYVREFVLSGKTEATFTIESRRFKKGNLVKSIKISDDTYIFLNTSIEPLDASIKLLKSQYSIIFVLILALSIFLSYFISNQITKPIIKISQTANKMGNGNFNVSFITESNIHEIKELSNTLEEAKKELSKTDELRKDLMANVGHDLKTPLTMIKAYAELTRDFNKASEEKRRENMSIIIEETDRLAELVNDILELSKMQSNAYELKSEEININELLKSIIKRYDILVENEQYDIVYENSKDILVKGDKKRIEQVIYNLLNNAINYTGKDKKVYIDVVENKKDIKIGIKDTGKGIEKSEIPLVWNKYYHNEKKHKRNVYGTGLGLAIVKNILDEHKVKYGIDSTIGKGTTFYFYLNK